MSKKGGGKKDKSQKMDLTKFLGTAEVGAVANDWAEDVWNGGVPEDAQAAADKRVFNHERKAGGLGNFRAEETKLLNSMVPLDMPPPYVAHFGNLIHSVTAEELTAICVPYVVKSVRIISRTLKGAPTKSTFAFVEFEVRDGLQQALTMNGMFLKNRPLRTDIATQQQQERMLMEQQTGGGDKALGGNMEDASSPSSFRSGGGRGGNAPQRPEALLDRESMGRGQQNYVGFEAGRGMNGLPLSQGGPHEFSRESFGHQQQPVVASLDTNITGLRQGNVQPPVEFSRELIGSVVQPTAIPPRFTQLVINPTSNNPNRNHTATSNNNAQPVVHHNTTNSAPVNSNSPVKANNSPVNSNGLANWRNEPPVMQPVYRQSDEQHQRAAQPPALPKDDDTAPNKNSAETRCSRLRTGGSEPEKKGAQPVSKETSPVVPQKPPPKTIAKKEVAAATSSSGIPAPKAPLKNAWTSGENKAAVVAPPPTSKPTTNKPPR